jgi:hypothetical protein
MEETMRSFLDILLRRPANGEEGIDGAPGAPVEESPLPGGWRPFAEAREFARGLGLRSRAEWTAYVKGRLPGKGRLPDDVPACPNVDYMLGGFAGFEDWLGVAEEAERADEHRAATEARDESGESPAPRTHDLAFYQALADVADTEILLFRIGEDRYVRAEAYDRAAHGGEPVFHRVEPAARV